jgi:hypothetical protein
VDAGGRVKTNMGQEQPMPPMISRVFLECLDAGGRYGFRRSLGRVHVFFPGGQVIARHASVPAPKFANPCGTLGFGFEVAMRAC